MKLSNEGIKNVPVEVNWYRNRLCIGCTFYKVAGGKTDNNGNFDFKVSIDSSFFREFHLNVSIPSDSTLMPANIEIGKTNRMDFYEFDPSGWGNIGFEYYPKAQLILQIPKTLANNFDNLFVSKYFNTRYGLTNFTISGRSMLNDTTIVVNTAANVYTKIEWRKNNVAGAFIEDEIDSLICTQNGPNVFHINY